MAREKIAKPKKFRQNREVKQHFHPRHLARSVVHNRLERAEVTGANKVIPGATQSAFARNWRNEADLIASK